MKFADFICANALNSDLKAKDKEGVIRQMAQALVVAGRIAECDYEAAVEAILQREQLGATTIARGVAVPHAKHSGVRQVSCAAAVCRPAIDFGSLNGESVCLVRFVFLLVSPQNRPDDYLKALLCIECQLRDASVCRSLTRAKSASEIEDLLHRADRNRHS